MPAMDDAADLIAKIGKKRYRRRQERERYFTQAIDLGGSPNPASLAGGYSSSSNMSTTVAGSKLAQEIHDEFLTCKICLEGFKSPKSLDCLHTFCEQCIENHVMSECSYKKYTDYREFTCPLCRKRTQLPLGGVKKLPDNFLVSSLGEVVARQRPSKFPFCDICKLVNRKHREATSKCLDCNKLLCKACVDLHRDTKVTKDHSLFDVEIEKDIECKEHQDEVVRFYCEPCETCICVLCTFNEHKDHEITQFSEAVSKYKEDIQNLLTACKTRTDVYDTQIDLLSKCETIIKNAEQRIHDVAIQFIADIRTREKELIDELHEIYGPELMEYVNRKAEMQNNLESLKSTCSLTELVLKGKDIELLLLKKQVQDKLGCLSDVTLKDLPKTVHKLVTFQPGSMELGCLQDLDRAASTSASSRPGLHAQLSLPSGRGNLSNGLHLRTTETQTLAAGKAEARMVSRYIQTQREPLAGGGEEGEREGMRAGGGVGSSRSSVASGTEAVFTQEKAVNTRSGSRQLSQSLDHSTTGTPEHSGSGGSSSRNHSSSSYSNGVVHHVGEENGVGTGGTGEEAAAEPPLSPGARRARRRRERLRQPVPVSVRPTTHNPGTTTTATATTVVSRPDGFSTYTGFW